MGDPELLSPDLLTRDMASVGAEITSALATQVRGELRKRGVVVALSGGIDSSVVAALSAEALGADRVLGVLMPERDSDDDTLRLSAMVASHLGLATVHHDITPILEATGCYARRDEAIRQVIPEYGPEWKSKIVLPSVTEGDQYRLFSVVARSPGGEEIRARLTPKAYLQVVAATNFKQRTRKMMEYYHADRLNYAVAGTPNRLEYDQGFFVKHGDGAADVKPIAHLYKTQVYALARHLGLPEEVCARAPTTDTYSLPQSQEEFYFSVPYGQMDLCLYALNHGIPASTVSEVTELSEEQVCRVFRDIEAKRAATRYLHLDPLLVERVEEIA